jgi:hypothetical protein
MHDALLLLCELAHRGIHPSLSIHHTWFPVLIITRIVSWVQSFQDVKGKRESSRTGHHHLGEIVSCKVGSLSASCITLSLGYNLYVPFYPAIWLESNIWYLSPHTHGPHRRTNASRRPWHEKPTGDYPPLLGSQNSFQFSIRLPE